MARPDALWLCVLLGALTGCEAAPAAPTTPTTPSAGPAAAPDAPKVRPAPVPPPPEAVEPYKRTREMMGTVISITVRDTPEARAASAVDAAFREMESLEAILSEWQPQSEISRINAGAGGAPIKVGRHTLAVVKAGLEVSRWSEGAFDISWAAMRGLYLFTPGEQRVPSVEEIAERLPLIDYRQIHLDEAASTVQLKQAGMRIGTGGIAKGYALDRAGETLISAGIDSYMIFGGGQIQVHGRKAGRPWRVGIQHPRRGDYFAMLEAESGSVSTSGDYERYFVRDGRRWHHILNTKTGLPVDHSTSVTVIAESGLYADALSTAVFVMGARRALKALPSAPGRPEAVIVDQALTLYISPGLEGALVLKAPLIDGKLPPAPER